MSVTRVKVDMLLVTRVKVDTLLVLFTSQAVTVPTFPEHCVLFRVFAY